MRIHPILYGILVVSVFLGIILGFQAAGVWSISGKVGADGQAIQPQAADPNTLKGWMTLEQVIDTYGVSMAELVAQFGLPPDTAPGTAIKDLESDTFDTTSLKNWLLERTAPAEVAVSETPTAAAPAQAAQEEKTAPATTNSTPTPAANQASSENSTPTPAPTAHSAPANTVTGKTTFQELLDWGVPREAIQKVIGGDLPAPSSSVKDFISAKGLEFPSIKAALQAEVDKLSQ